MFFIAIYLRLLVSHSLVAKSCVWIQEVGGQEGFHVCITIVIVCDNEPTNELSKATCTGIYWRCVDIFIYFLTDPVTHIFNLSFMPDGFFSYHMKQSYSNLKQLCLYDLKLCISVCALSIFKNPYVPKIN